MKGITITIKGYIHCTIAPNLTWFFSNNLSCGKFNCHAFWKVLVLELFEWHHMWSLTEGLSSYMCMPLCEICRLYIQRCQLCSVILSTMFFYLLPGVSSPSPPPVTSQHSLSPSPPHTPPLEKALRDSSFSSPLRPTRPLHRPFSPPPPRDNGRESPSNRSLSPGEVVRSPSSPVHVIHPTVTHPMWPYFYHSGLHPGALPFSVGQMLLGGAGGNPGGTSGLPTSPFFPGSLAQPLPAHHPLSEATTSVASSPTFSSPHASWASHLALASHPMLYQHYAAAVSQAAAAAASIASSENSHHPTTSSTSSSIGSILSSRLPQRFTPYTIPKGSTSPPSGTSRPPLTPGAPLTPPSVREDSPRVSEDGKHTPPPVTACGDRTPSELKNMERMVCGLERQQEKLATDTLTKLVDK